MRWPLVVVLAGCAAPPAPAVPREPLPDTASSTCVELGAAEPPPDAHRAELAHELDAIDRELDAIDDEIAASAIPGPQSRQDAINAAIARTTELERATPQQPPEDCPTLLARAAHAWLEARGAELQLAETLGARHPDRIAAQRTIEMRRVDFDQQRAVELAETAAWRVELGKLPESAPAIRIFQASRRALRTTLAQLGDATTVPSDAPAELRMAAHRAAELAHAIDVSGKELGPKHPEMIRLTTETRAARDKLAATLAATEVALDREIAALDHRKAPLPIDPATLARRAELAARARELRKELDHI